MKIQYTLTNTNQNGTDENIVVATIKVLGKEPAKDLENFIEKGYDWIIDAEPSAGEISDGKYIVS